MTGAIKLYIFRLRKLFLPGLLLVAACGDALDAESVGSPEQQQLTVYAAASLVEAFSRLGEEFENLHPEVEVVTSFAGSQQIAQQLSQGAPGDIFASADQRQMDNVIHAGRVIEGTDQVFIHNQLVLILPADNPGEIYRFEEIATPGLQLIMADEAVPVGAYAQQMLELTSQASGFRDDFKASVLGNVVSYEENVRAVLTKIILGEADAGIVYMSDAAGSSAENLQTIPIPEEVNIKASYFVATLADSLKEQLAEDFISLVLSPQGQEILSHYGFMKLEQDE
jgi:molybdate transport system substrate-binding protein